MPVRNRIEIEARMRGGKQVANETRKMEKGFLNLKSTIGSVAPALIGFAGLAGIGMLVKSTITASALFERLKARLVGMKGSMEAANKTFGIFNEIAATTPFALNEVVEAGIQLEAFGLDSENVLKSITDLAAFMGTGVVEAANAMGRAFAGGQGAADVLRERGILNLIGVIQGSSIPLEEFREKLLGALVDPELAIVGSTDRISKTFEGMVSNLGDNLTVLSADIGDIFMPVVKDMISSVSSIVKEIDNFIRSLGTLEERLVGLSLEKQKQLLEKELRAMGELAEQTEKTSNEFSAFGDGLAIADEIIQEATKHGKMLTETERDAITVSNERHETVMNLKAALEGVNDKILEQTSADLILVEGIKGLGEETFVLGEIATVVYEKMARSSEESYRRQLDSAMQFFSGTTAAMGAISNLSRNLTQQKLQEISQEQSAATDAVENSTLSEQDKAARIAIIQEKFRKKELEAKGAFKGVKIADAISNTALAVTKALSSLPPPFSFIAAAATAAAGLVQVKTIRSSKFGRGGDFLTSQPTSIIVGDNPGGIERVTITPISSPNFDGAISEPSFAVTINELHVYGGSADAVEAFLRSAPFIEGFKSLLREGLLKEA